MNELTNTTQARTFKVESQSCVNFEGRDIPNTTNGVPTEVMQQVFIECVLNGAFQSLSCTNVHCYYTIKQFLNEKKITQLPVAVLNILDAETQGFKVKNEPPRNCFKEFEWFLKLAPFVENNEGLTLLTIPAGLTLNQLVQIAKEAGIKVVFGWDKVLKEQGEIAINETYRVMITNAPVTETRSKLYEAQHSRVVNQAGFEDLPTLMEYLLLIISTQKVSEKCLYRKNLLTYGRSPTHVGNFPLVVGGSAPGRVDVDCSGSGYGSEDCGAGGRRKV